jgi:hypothetical protein
VQHETVDRVTEVAVSVIDLSVSIATSAKWIVRDDSARLACFLWLTLSPTRNASLGPLSDVVNLAAAFYTVAVSSS